ncbi:16S rRNA (guanine(966)-N(2))-methyltransferase RsmD [Humidisolicoccus flavus]|uniref:16S rRNA (guanine(966)-N(2))-methyltransferase RsmD n=1 Tax=Humidisolicoccus flavus TaxID=3111414 RepID=UPI003251263E
MTRIIAGLAASARLQVPAKGTRPTSERVREAIFAALDARDACDGATVLDLFAGSGALGLEALSRGASRAVLVESHRAAAAVATKNVASVAKMGVDGASVVAQDALRYLEGTGEMFSLVFLDPPYDFDNTALASVLQSLAAHVSDDAIILVERDRRSGEPPWPGGLVFDRSKQYGDTVLWWARGGVAQSPSSDAA